MPTFAAVSGVLGGCKVFLKILKQRANTRVAKWGRL